MTKVDGGQQRNNQPLKGTAKAGGGGGGNRIINGSGEDGDGDGDSNGNATAPVMDSNGRCDGDGKGIHFSRQGSKKNTVCLVVRKRSRQILYL
jgi:hypothetical protein